jgi:hypothetical protein
MTWITRHVLAIGMAILPVLFPASNSIAQQCTGSKECPFPLMCLPGFFGGYCDFAPCNTDTECRNGSVCEGGVCSAPCRHTSDCPRGEVCTPARNSGVCVPPPPPPPPPEPPPPVYYTEGGVCGTIRLGGISGPVKHLGCAPGLQCVGQLPNGRGTCQRAQ